MTYQEALVPLIEDAYAQLFSNAEKLSDKLDFKASKDNRTPLEMLVECVTMPDFLAPVIRNRALPENTDDYEEPKGLDSVDACKRHYEKAKNGLLEAIRNFPAEHLHDEFDTPWGHFSWLSFIAYAYWNPMYHVGQLAYIQMMHGDTKM